MSLFKNYGSKPIKVPIGKYGFWVKPGVVFEIDEGYAKARSWSNGTRRESIIEELCPNREVKEYRTKTLMVEGKPQEVQDNVYFRDFPDIAPAEEDDILTWKEAPALVERTQGAVTVQSLMKQGIPKNIAIEMLKVAARKQLEELEKLEETAKAKLEVTQQVLIDTANPPIPKNTGKRG